VAAGERVLEELLGLAGVRGHGAWDPQGAGYDTVEGRDALRARAVEEVVAVEMQSKKNGESGTGRFCACVPALLPNRLIEI